QLRIELGEKPVRVKKFLELAKAINCAVEKANEYESRDVLKTVSSNLVIDGKTLVVTWLNPFGEIAKVDKSQFGEPYRDTSRTLARKSQSSSSKKKPHIRVSKFSRKLFGLIQNDPPNTDPSSHLKKGREV